MRYFSSFSSAAASARLRSVTSSIRPCMQQLAVLADDHGGGVAHPEHAAVAGDHPVLRAQLVARPPAAGSSSSITRSRSSGWMLLIQARGSAIHSSGVQPSIRSTWRAHERPAALLAEARPCRRSPAPARSAPRGAGRPRRARPRRAAGRSRPGRRRRSRRPRRRRSRRDGASRPSAWPCGPRRSPRCRAPRAPGPRALPGVGEVLGVEQLEPVAPRQLLAGPAERALEREAREGEAHAAVRRPASRTGLSAASRSACAGGEGGAEPAGARQAARDRI